MRLPTVALVAWSLFGAARADSGGDSEAAGGWQGRLVIQPEFQATFAQRGNTNVVHASGPGLMSSITVAVGGGMGARALVGMHGMYVGMIHPSIDGHGETVRVDGTLGFWGVGPVLMGMLRDNASYFSAAALLSGVSGKYAEMPNDDSFALGLKLGAGRRWNLSSLSLGVSASAFVSGGFWTTNSTLGIGAGVFAAF